MIFAFGDSFVQGFQDGKTDQSTEIYEKNHVSFVSKLDSDFKNFAIRGSSNFVQLDLLLENINNISSSDLVLFGFTASIRDRWRCGIELEKNLSIGNHSLIHKKLLDSPGRAGNHDFYFSNSVLNEIEKHYNLRIVRFNCFNNQITDCDYKIDYGNFLGKNIVSNTLCHILNDTWGSNQKYEYHKDMAIPKGYENLYTIGKHPSTEGHVKIANWFKTNVLAQYP